MQEIISCPACQRKLQVPESLLGQDVRCPTCGATFVARLADEPQPAPHAAAPPPRWAPEPEPPLRPRPRRRGPDDYDDGYDDYEDHRDDRYPARRRRDRYLAPHRGSAVLTLGILSLVVCGPVLGPIAWVMGQGDLGEMRAGRMDREGEGLTSAGRICGMIGTILSISLIAIYFLFFVVFAAALSGR
jgi:hypothetical protein